MKLQVFVSQIQSIYILFTILGYRYLQSIKMKPNNKSSENKQPLFISMHMSDCNRIIIEKKGGVIYLPTYLSVNIRNFRQLQFEQLFGQISAFLSLAVYIQDLPQQIVSELDNIIVNTPFHANISLNPNINKQADIHNKLITGKTLGFTDERRKSKNIFKRFKILMDFKTSIQPYLRFTPFELVDLVLTFSIKTITIKLDSKELKKTQVKFVLMDNNYPQELVQKKINFNASAVFGQYDLAQKKLHVQYSTNAQYKSLVQLGKYIYNFKIKQQSKQKFDKVEQYAHFHIPLYKFPYIPLLTITIPLIVLGIINLAVFYQAPGLGERIGNISALMIAFIGIIPVIRESIPRTPIITVVEILVYLQTLTTILCLFESIRVRHQQEVRKVHKSVLFKLSFFITMIVAIIPMVMILIHQFYLKKNYNQKVRSSSGQNYKQYMKDWTKNDLFKFFFKQKQSEFLFQIKPQQGSTRINSRQHTYQSKYRENYNDVLTKISKSIPSTSKRIKTLHLL